MLVNVVVFDIFKFFNICFTKSKLGKTINVNLIAVETKFVINFPEFSH